MRSGLKQYQMTKCAKKYQNTQLKLWKQTFLHVMPLLEASIEHTSDGGYPVILLNSLEN
jgi:hypothetical protein